MKRTYKKLKYRFAAIFIAVILMVPSCELDNDVYSIYTPETFYKTDFQVLSALSGAYRDFANMPTFWHTQRAMELSADELIVHGKIQGWWANTDREQLIEHQWTEDNGVLQIAWDDFFKTVGQANALMSALESSSLASATNAKAELRALRGYAYFLLMDLFGNVPIFTLPKVDPLNLPTQNTRAEVFNFVVSELKKAEVDLPSQNDAGSDYYGRLTKEAVYGMLAYAYLNAEVYTGTAKLDSCLIYTDKIIDSKAFSLLDNYFDNFVYNNDENDEGIFTCVYSPDVSGGIGHPIVQKVMPGITGGLFGLPYTPQNGFGTRPSVYDRYEDGDDRKEIFLYYGPLIDPRNGDTVKVERIVPDNNSVLYDPVTSTEGPEVYEIIPATGIRLQPMNAGVKWIKWGLDPNTNGGNAGNDISLIRYADILLMKAEALFRINPSDAEALTLVNTIRGRSNATALPALTLDDICEERARELVFELKRRTDLIRFGKFNEAWEFKEASESYRTLYPIPRSALDANPNLTQNTGY